jgi:hypothetical protein
VAGSRVQTTGLTLLSHSRLLLRPKPAMSRGKMPGGEFSLRKRKGKLLDSSCCVARWTRAYIGAGTEIESRMLNMLTFVKASSFFPSTSPDGLPV